MYRSVMLQRDACLLLVDRLRELRPKVAVECGSGFSTHLMALYCDELISLENLPRHAAKAPSVRICDLDRNGWYRTQLPDGIEFALIDGPLAKRYGRQGTFPGLWPHLADEFEVWLDDAKRGHEQDLLEQWIRKYPIAVELVDTVKGLAIIRRRRDG